MENTSAIEMNEYQTPLTDELLGSLPEEVKEELLDTINSVELIKRLISPNRVYAKDRPRDEQGRIIVDLANPHILEDMDYFRQPALHFMKHGCYTFLRPNSNPNSEYRKHWDEEMRRCREGYVRESDGEWVTGFLYWFLNYCPMMVNKVISGTRKAVRVESFPFFFEGIYWRFHYLHQAREAGKHAIELAKRGAHPYFQKVFTPEGWKLWKDIKIGDKLYATDNSVCTVIDIPYDQVSPYYKITLRDGRTVFATDDHLWNIERKGKNMTVNTAWLLSNYKTNRTPSYRIPSGIEYNCFIPGNEGINLPYKDTLVEPYTFGLLLGDGCFRHGSCYFTQIDKDFDIEKNYIPYKYTKWAGKYSYRVHIPNWNSILQSYGLNNAKSIDKFIPEEYKYNSRDVRLKVLKGLFDTDGSIHGGVPTLNSISKRLIEDVDFIARSLGYNTKISKSRARYKAFNGYIQCSDCYEIAVYGGEELFNLPRKKSGVHYSSTNALSRKNKTAIVNIEYAGVSPCKCVTVDSKDSCYLVGDFITTHNCAKSYSLASIMSHNLILGESTEVKRRVITVLTAYQKEYLSDSKDGTLSKFKPGINFSFKNTPFPRLMLKNSPNEMAWQMGYKDEFGIESGSLNQVLAVSAKDDSEKLRGKRGWILFEEMGSFKGLLSLYDITRKSVEDGDYTFATMYLVGCVCAGTKVWTLDGRNINIEDLKREDGIIGFTDSFESGTEPNIHLTRGITKEPIMSSISIAKKPCVLIKLSNGNELRCSTDHPILTQKQRMNHNGSIRYYEEVFKNAGALSVGDRIIESREVPIFGTDTMFDPRLVGMLIGDGSYGLRQSPKYSSEDKELLDYVKHRYEWSLSATHITKKGKIYEDIRIKGICNKLRELGI
jgi:intein/homing endonuclease